MVALDWMVYTYIMERTQIYLSAMQAAVLDREARRRRQTRSHLIREAIDKVYLSEPSSDEWQQALEASFGAWADRRQSGEAYVEQLRAGQRLSALWGERWEEEDDAE
jgi:predicted transcriptional regulator